MVRGVVVEFNSPITATPINVLGTAWWVVEVEWWAHDVETGEDRKFCFHSKEYAHHPSKTQVANAVAEAVRHEAMEQLGLPVEHE